MESLKKHLVQSLILATNVWENKSRQPSSLDLNREINLESVWNICFLFCFVLVLVLVFISFVLFYLRVGMPGM